MLELLLAFVKCICPYLRRRELEPIDKSNAWSGGQMQRKGHQFQVMQNGGWTKNGVQLLETGQIRAE